MCETCSHCAAGKYKDAAGTQACRNCPQNTYNPNTNSKAFANCLPCPNGADTDGLDGRTSSDACQCGDRYYLAGAGGSSISCASCPSGAMCNTGVCALRSQDQACPGSSDSIPGTWVRLTSGDNAGRYSLISCPAGYQTQNTTHDTQACHACLESQYIIDPDEDACEKCPPGLECQGDHVVVSVVENATWSAENGVYKLQSCPTGYSKIRVDGEWDQQKCEPCAAGTECVLEVCETCSLCTAGKYKDAAGTQACRDCPQNTYNPDAGATSFANCLTCPSGADTNSKGMTHLENCTCPIRTYLTVSAGITACKSCPRGGECDDRNLGCGLRKKPYVCPIVGDWLRDISSNEFTLVGCPVGHKLQNASGHDNLACLKCAEGFYVQNPRDPSDVCRKCPSSATCVNGAPPIFQASKVTGTVELAGLPKEDGEDAVRQALANLLGVQISQIVLLDQSRRHQRRSTSRPIVFEIVGDTSQVASLAEDLKDGNLASQLSSQLSKQYAMNITVTVSGGAVAQTLEKTHAGEKWVEVGGEYLLRACPRGFILVNTTVETQECRECQIGTFNIDSLRGCTDMGSERRCDARPCSACPEGVTCNRGSAPAWSHFSPKPLKLLDYTIPWVTVVQPSGTSSHLYCEAESQTCVPLELSTKAEAAPARNSDDEHVWEYSHLLNTFVLTTCPAGFQLVNSSNGVFNPTLQRCNPCGPTFYIIDRASSCQKCPKGATCPDGAQFIPNDWSEVGKENGSKWEIEQNAGGDLVYRVVECPAGYHTSYNSEIPGDDACIRCIEGKYRLSRAGRNASECRECEPSADCRGGTDIQAKAGYWRLQFLYVGDYESKMVSKGSSQIFVV